MLIFKKFVTRRKSKKIRPLSITKRTIPKIVITPPEKLEKSTIIMTDDATKTQIRKTSNFFKHKLKKKQRKKSNRKKISSRNYLQLPTEHDCVVPKPKLILPSSFSVLERLTVTRNYNLQETDTCIIGRIGMASVLSEYVALQNTTWD